MARELGLPVPPGFVDHDRGLPGVPRRRLARRPRRRAPGADGRRSRRPSGGGSATPRIRCSSASGPGAPVSMPGMMDTILDLGLNDATERGLAAATGDPAFAADCRERFRAMFRVDRRRRRRARRPVAAAPARDRGRLPLVEQRPRAGVPREGGDPRRPRARPSPSRRWSSATAAPIPATGVAVHAQPGDRRAACSTATCCSTPRARTSSPGPTRPSRSPRSTSGCRRSAAELRDVADRLERHYADLCDIEFTIEDGRLWMLQVRVGKRSPRRRCGSRSTWPRTRRSRCRGARRVERVAYLLADPPTRHDRRGAAILLPLVTGLGASPGVASGEIATTPGGGRARGRTPAAPSILVRAETSPDDVHGMAHVGRDPHRARRAREPRGGRRPRLGHPGGGRRERDRRSATARSVIGGRTFRDGDTITIDGASGEVFEGEIPGRTEPVPRGRGRCSAGPRSSASRSAPATSRSPRPRLRAAPASAPVTLDSCIRRLATKGFATTPALADALLHDAGSRPAAARPAGRRWRRGDGRRRVPAHGRGHGSRRGAGRGRPRRVGRRAARRRPSTRSSSSTSG